MPTAVEQVGPGILVVLSYASDYGGRQNADGLEHFPSTSWKDLIFDFGWSGLVWFGLVWFSLPAGRKLSMNG